MCIYPLATADVKTRITSYVRCDAYGVILVACVRRRGRRLLRVTREMEERQPDYLTANTGVIAQSRGSAILGLGTPSSKRFHWSRKERPVVIILQAQARLLQAYSLTDLSSALSITRHGEFPWHPPYIHFQSSTDQLICVAPELGWMSGFAVLGKKCLWQHSVTKYACLLSL